MKDWLHQLAILRKNGSRASSYVTYFNTRNKLLTQKLLKQGYWYHKLRKTFSKFYRFDIYDRETINQQQQQQILAMDYVLDSLDFLHVY